MSAACWNRHNFFRCCGLRASHTGGEGNSGAAFAPTPAPDRAPAHAPVQPPAILAASRLLFSATKNACVSSATAATKRTRPPILTVVLSRIAFCVEMAAAGMSPLIRSSPSGAAFAACADFHISNRSRKWGFRSRNSPDNLIRSLGMSDTHGLRSVGHWPCVCFEVTGGPDFARPSELRMSGCGRGRVKTMGVWNPRDNIRGEMRMRRGRAEARSCPPRSGLVQPILPIPDLTPFLGPDPVSVLTRTCPRF